MIGGAGVAAAIGDPSRFASAPDFMAYLGMVPSEHSTGPKRRIGLQSVDVTFCLAAAPGLGDRIANRREIQAQRMDEAANAIKCRAICVMQPGSELFDVAAA